MAETLTRRWSILTLGLASLSLAPALEAQVIKLPPTAFSPGAPLSAPPSSLLAFPSASPATPLALAPAAPASALPTPANQAPAATPAPAALMPALQNAGKIIAAGKPAEAAKAVDQLFNETSRGAADAVAVPEGASRSAARLEKQPLKSGVDLSAMDTSVRPQDDFFRYANGGWLKTYKMPDDISRFGATDELMEKNTAEIKDIITGGKSDKKISDLYRSFMDEKAIEAKGLAPISDRLARIDAIKGKEELPAAFAAAGRIGEDAPVHLSVGADAKDSNLNTVDLSQSGLGLPEREYYFNEGDKAEEIRTAYRAYAAKLLALSGEKDAEAKADAVYALEKQLAAVSWKIEDNRDPLKTYNKTTAEKLSAAAPGFDWAAFLREAKIPAGAGEFNVDQPGFLTGFAKLAAETPIETWKLYLKLRALEAAAPYMPHIFVETSFAFHGQVLSGQPAMRPRWKRGVDLVNGALGELVGKEYVARHFPASAKTRVEDMTKNVLAAYADHLKAVDWLGEETKLKALEKLSKITVQIGYPNKWRDYSKLAVVPDDLMGNIRRSNLFDYDTMVGKLGKPVDRDEWGMTPQMVNAEYSPSVNKFILPAAILQYPFFDYEADDAYNYGATGGGTIGHENTHGFDDEGSQYDGEGNLHDWWTAKDRAEFAARGEKLARQFDAYEPLPGQHINGRNTLGENIADLGGMSIAYDAYRRSLNGNEAPIIDGLTGDQRFFLGYAQGWREAIRQKLLAQRLATDVHAPAEWRVNGVMPNLDSFYSAFGVKDGDKLFRSLKDRVKIW